MNKISTLLLSLILIFLSYFQEFSNLQTTINRKSSSARPAEGRPPRSVLYYMKAYESGVSLMPVQLPPRTTINQVVNFETLSEYEI